MLERKKKPDYRLRFLYEFERKLNQVWYFNTRTWTDDELPQSIIMGLRFGSRLR